MQNIYKVLSTLKHDGVEYLRGTFIQDVAGLEHLVGAGVLEIVKEVETVAQADVKADETTTTAPATDEQKSDVETDDKKPAPFPVVGAGDQDPDDTKKADPDTGANL